MGARSLLVATLISTALARPGFAEERMLTPPEAAHPENEETEPEQEERRRSLSLEYGVWRGNGSTYTSKGAALSIDGYLVVIQLREEYSQRREEDEIDLAGIVLEGIRKSKLYQADITFGYALWQPLWNRFGLNVYALVRGGIQLDTSKFRTEGEEVAGDVDIDFILGGGLRGESFVRVPKIPVDIGMGINGGYLDDRIDWDKLESGAYAGGYAFIRFSRYKK